MTRRAVAPLTGAVRTIAVAAAVALVGAVGAPAVWADHPIEPDRATLAALGRDPDPGPVDMLNLLKFRRDGGRQAYARYSAVALVHVLKRGGRLSFLGHAERGDPLAGDWDAAAVVRYPSRKAFLDMVSDPTYLRALPDRRKGLERTVLYAFRSADPGVRPPRPAPPVAGTRDAPVVLVCLLKYRAGAERATPSRPAVGGTVLLDLPGERPLVSDRSWDRLLVVEYPSRRALPALPGGPNGNAGALFRGQKLERAAVYVFTPGQ